MTHPPAPAINIPEDHISEGIFSNDACWIDSSPAPGFLQFHLCLPPVYLSLFKKTERLLAVAISWFFDADQLPQLPNALLSAGIA